MSYMEVKFLLLFACLVTITLSAILGILASYAELKAKQPKYSIYIKASTLLIGIAGVLAALIATFT